MDNNEKVNERMEALTMLILNSQLSSLIKLYNSKVVAPKIAGIDNNKENLAADFLSNPSNRPAVIVMPDRLVPGKKANIWKVPIMRPLIIFKSSIFFILKKIISTKYRITAKISVHHAINSRVLNIEYLLF